MTRLALPLTLLSSLAAAAPVTRLAAPQFTVVNIAPELAAFYANEVARHLKEQGLKVVTAADIAAVLGNERQKQLLGCAEDSTSCMAELGAALGCEGILTANLARLGDAFRGSLKVVSSRDGATLAEQPVNAGNEAALADALAEAARKIGRTLNPPPPLNLRPYSLVPFIAGGVSLVGSVASFAIAGKKLNDIPELSSEAAAQVSKQQGETAQTAAWVTAGVAAAALTTGALMFFLGKPPAVTPSVAVTGEGAAVGLNGSF